MDILLVWMMHLRSWNTNHSRIVRRFRPSRSKVQAIVHVDVLGVSFGQVLCRVKPAPPSSMTVCVVGSETGADSFLSSFKTHMGFPNGREQLINVLYYESSVVTWGYHSQL